jgi:hypothetical protein
MPKEVRRLVFTHPESTQAVVDYGQKFNMIFPKGRIIRAKFAGDAEFEFHTMRDFKSPVHRTYNVQEKRSAVIITFFDETTFEHKYFNLTADFVSAALVEFCLHHKIMLPKMAAKQLDITEFNICLDVNFENYLVAEPPALKLDDPDKTT